MGRYLLERSIAACFKKLGQAVEAVRQTGTGGVVLDVGGMSGTCSPLLGLLLPHIICRRQHRLVALVAVEGVRRRKGRMAIRDAAFEGRIQGLQSDDRESALACQHIDWRMCYRVRCCPEALACGVFAAGADGQVGVCRLAVNRDANPCTDECLTAKRIRAADGPL